MSKSGIQIHQPGYGGTSATLKNSSGIFSYHRHKTGSHKKASMFFRDPKDGRSIRLNGRQIASLQKVFLAGNANADLPVASRRQAKRKKS